jgi:hypothetical protein
MTVAQYQICYTINNTIKDETERLAMIVCELFGLTPEQVDGLSGKAFIKYVSKMNKMLNTDFKKPFYSRLKLKKDAKHLTFGEFIELQHWLKKDAIEVLHLVSATLIIKKNKQHDTLANKVLKLNVKHILNDCLSFIESLQGFMKLYKGLFEIEDNNDEDFNEFDKKEKLKSHPFVERYGWIFSAKQVADHNCISLNEAYELPVIQALNDLSYLKSKQDYETKMSK